MTLEAFLDRLPGKKKQIGDEWQVCCPIHDDSNPSASVRLGDSGKILFHCHGCYATMTDVCEKLGIEMAEVMGDAAEPKPQKQWEGKFGRYVESYRYRDEAGRLVFVKDRYVRPDGTKTFIQKCPADIGSTKKWEYGLKKLDERGQRRPLYELPELLHGIKAGRVAFFVEGEKDVLALKAEGLLATTTSEGAGGAWRDHYVDYFEGARCVVIIPDNDPPPKDTATPGWQGQDYALLKREKLEAAGVNCRVVELPELVNGRRVKDCSDFLKAGGSPEDLKRLAQVAIEKEKDEWVHPRERPDAPIIPEAPEGAKKKARAPSEARMKRDWNDKSLPAETRCAIYCDWLIYHVEKKGQPIAWAVEAAVRFDGDGVTRELKNGIMCRVVLRWLNSVGKLYYHKEHRDFRTGMFFLKADKSLCNVDSDWFRSWVSRRIGVNREEARFKRIWSAIQDEVLQGEQAVGVLPECYFARRGNLFPAAGEKRACAIYISNGVGQMARITARGVEMVDNGTDGVLFPSDKTLDPWELTSSPRDPFTECAIWREMEVANPRDRLVFKLWALGLALNNEAKPPLCVTGGAGSGKTTAVRGLFRLYGIAQRNLTVDTSEKGAQSFWVSMNAGGLLLLDNMDTSVRWFANAAESASTGADFEAKRLYTDSELVRLKPRAWLAVTSLRPAFASSAALADRMLFVSLLRRPDKVTKESEIYSEVSNIRNDGMTFVCEIIRKVLADKWNGDSPNRRHPDFGKAAIRIGRALGCEEEVVMALKAVESDKYIFNLKNDVFGEIFMRLIVSPREFTSAAFFEQMRNVMGEDYIRNARWNAVKVGKAIDKLWESLRFCYKIDRRFVRGSAVYSVNPKDFILREAHQLEQEGLDVSAPSTSSGNVATNSTFNMKTAEQEGVEDVAEYF